ncbi:MAG: isoprenylcysteine carboxylmethyltransferase family protein [Saprospirales bacterium]|nr:MAG: isoprenylcysteine carboxylmethyltransferase family protein [Saprospirales bacterium]
MTYVFLTIGWVIYYSLHTLLADLQVKKFVYTKVPTLKDWYRLIYNLLALSGLILLIYFSFLQETLLWEFQTWHWIPVLVFGIPGLVIMGKSAKTFDLPEFFGLIKSTAMDKGASEEGLIQSGLYAYVRHPLYIGTILFVLSIVFLFPLVSLGIFFVSMLIYLPIGIHFEEKKLIREYGHTYKAYQKRVKRLIPGVY